MGLQIKDIVKTHEIELEHLNNKIVAIDSFNLLYQFLTTIRQQDGSPLVDKNGNITSHLTGLFNRTMNFLAKGIKPVFVFDGEPPELKKKERERRKEVKIEAEKKYNQAKEEGDISEMKKYASRTTKLSKEMIEEAKKLVEAMGVPYVNAPSEGEAQAAYMTKKGDAYASVSQDFDTLMFGSNKLVRNLSISGRRKRSNSSVYSTIKPEVINLSEMLNALGVDNDQLIAMAMLIGTDFNPGGIKGIGPNKALKIVKENGKDFESIFKKVEWDSYFDFTWEEVYYTIKKIPTTDEYKLEWKSPDKEKIIELMCTGHDFSLERITAQLDKLEKSTAGRAQKGLSDFF